MNEQTNFIVFSSPLGPLWIAATQKGICNIIFGDVPVPFSKRLGRYGIGNFEPGRTAVLDDAEAQLRDYFAGALREFTLPLDLRGTPFQLAVWDVVRSIPYGATMSYSEIARSLDRPKAARGVGGAVGANPVVIVVPCHRVMGKNGQLTGYGGGLPRKISLLEIESM